MVLDFTSDASLSEDLAFDVMERLGEYGAVTAFDIGGTKGSVVLGLNAPSVVEALVSARSAVEDAMPGMQLTVLSAQVFTQDEFDRMVHEPLYPPVVSNAEIARMAGVTRQRVGQLVRSKSFPKPVIMTEHAKLYAKSAVEAWLAGR
ncbi:hypothetical protein BCUN_1385 [Bifidobacterium cuniculi]|uniref:Uncharacterized protein n=1 Tax=Bifidobacterium cuniculi TaxID=1688 RepID=A0A087ATG9_9BIFI|nr:hypothetical protein BCUN_1385 [Bifidobacterium cuniculi]